MSEEKEPLEGFEDFDSVAGGVYTNDSYANVLATEVAITFGDGTRVEDGRLKAVAKVVMSHASFMGFVEYLIARYDFINESLGGRPKTMGEVFTEDPERVKELMKKYIFKSKNDEGNSDGTNDSNK
jgi:hypothetical protein